jgi:hypothetical protein
MLSRTLLALAAALTIVNPVAHAEKAHVHGAAELNVGVENDTLRIALESPLDSLLGFERAPKATRNWTRYAAWRASYVRLTSCFYPLQALAAGS